MYVRVDMVVKILVRATLLFCHLKCVLHVVFFDVQENQELCGEKVETNVHLILVWDFLHFQTRSLLNFSKSLALTNK